MIDHCIEHWMEDGFCQGLCDIRKSWQIYNLPRFHQPPAVAPAPNRILSCFGFVDILLLLIFTTVLDPVSSSGRIVFS